MVLRPAHGALLPLGQVRSEQTRPSKALSPLEIDKLRRLSFANSFLRLNFIKSVPIGLTRRFDLLAKGLPL